MNPRQLKKLCKKSKEILISGGIEAVEFCIDPDESNGIPVLGLGLPDYFGEYNWFDAWFILLMEVIDDTTIYTEFDCTRSNCPTKTPDILNHARQMAKRKAFKHSRFNK